MALRRVVGFFVLVLEILSKVLMYFCNDRLKNRQMIHLVQKLLAVHVEMSPIQKTGLHSQISETSIYSVGKRKKYN